MKLFEWRDEAWFYAKHLLSVRASLFAAVWAGAGGWWILAPPDWHPFLPEWFKWVLAVVGVLVAAAPGMAATMHQPKLLDTLIAHKIKKGGP